MKTMKQLLEEPEQLSFDFPPQRTEYTPQHVAQVSKAGSGMTAREILDEMRLRGDSHNKPHNLLHDYPIGGVTHDSEQDVDQRKVDSYAETPGDKFPPIVLGSWGNIIEGHHRWYAAKKRGDETIKAYCPTSVTRQIDVWRRSKKK